MDLPESIPPADQPVPDIPTSLAPPPPENPAWNLVDVLAVTFIWLITVVSLGTLVLFVIFGLPGAKKLQGDNAALVVPLQTVAYLLMVAFIAQMIRLRRGGRFLNAISWNTPRIKTALLFLAGGIGLAFFSDVFSILFSRWTPKSLPIERFFQDADSAYLLAFYGVIVAPFVEELFFRGFLYPALARRIGVGASVILTALCFSLMHWQQLGHAWAPLLWLFLVGMVLTIVRARTKSLAASVLVHISYNCTLFLVLFVVTNGFHHMERA